MASIINSTDTGQGGLIATGDNSDELQLQTAETARVTLTNTAVVVNEDGNDVDFRVEGDTDANLLFVDASTDRVGIGTSTPGDELEIYASNSTPRLRFTGASSVASGVQIGLLDSTNGVISNTENGYLLFGTNNTERIRILASGGITFNGDTAAANALDDYEEGTWTPTFTFSGGAGTLSYSTRSGVYTKVGGMVTVQCLCVVANKGTASGSMSMILPFTSLSGTNYSAAAMTWNNISYSANSYIISAQIGAGGADLNFYNEPNGSFKTTLNVSQCASGFEIIFTVSYRVA